jgi:hypothetical protein
MFGNLVGETGDAASPLRVSAMDLLALRRNVTPTPTNPFNPHDLNHDGFVNALDYAAARANLFHTLRPIALPAPPAPAAALAAARVWDEPQASLL